MALFYLRLSLILICLLSTNTFAFENLVYTVRGFPHQIMLGSIAIQDLKAHTAQINILSSQAYHVNEKGTVYGSQNPQMVQIANDAHIKLMPLLGNANFEPKPTHLFLNDPRAQERAVQSVLRLCKENHFYGVQIDFEGMSFLDRDAFTQFYQRLARALHQHGFKVAIALIPTLTDSPPATDYLKANYQGWSGVYDYKALGQSSDFVTLMAYDQHGDITVPGPMAGLHWDEAIVRYALQLIPAEKISLGIPWHSAHWYTGKNARTNIAPVSEDLRYADMQRLLQDTHASLQWDNDDKVHYAIYRHHYLYEYIFAEDAASFREKLKLVKQYQLRGISNWCLGEEDPGVWEVLKER